MHILFRARHHDLPEALVTDLVFRYYSRLAELVIPLTWTNEDNKYVIALLLNRSLSDGYCSTFLDGILLGYMQCYSWAGVNQLIDHGAHFCNMSGYLSVFYGWAGLQQSLVTDCSEFLYGRYSKLA